MQKSIENFIKTTDNGLYLIDLPTGTGKTTQAIDYIYNHMDKNTTFFYVTSLNKNVDDAYNKLRKKFKDAGKLNEFEDMVLRLYSNSEKIIENLCTVPYNPDDEIMRFNSFIQLKKEVEMLDKIVNIDLSIKDKLVTEIREKLEPAFRHDVKIFLNDKCNTKKERFKYIKEHHNWLIQIYPSILTNFRKVFFASLDKFYLGNDAIIEPSYKFTNNKYLMGNAVIFIDEIDAAKNTVLSRIVEDSLKNNVDLIKLFLNIYTTLETKEFPQEMLKPTLDEAEEEGYKINITQRMKELFEEIFNKHNMQFALKLLEKDIDKKFIFDDNTTLTIINKKNVNDMYVNSNKDEGYNRIIYDNSNNNPPLSMVIKNIIGGISYFIKGCYLLAVHYCEYYNKNKKPADDLMQIEDSVLSVLHAFNINERYIPYLENVILGKGRLNQSYASTFAADVYDTGFKYYKFSDSLSNNFSTLITMYDINDTPESFLLNLVSKGHVIGLSATSTMDTVTGNFDLTYLRSKLGGKFYKPTEEEKERIDSEINKIIVSNKAKIDVEFVKSIDPETTIKELFVTEDYQNVIMNKFGDLSKNTEIFNANRFLKVALSIKSFMTSRLSSLLILTNRNLGKDNGLFSEQTFDNIINLIKKEYNVENEFTIINLTTKEFEETKKLYLDKLNKNEKVIIFSSYPTTGAGQNLQYEIEEDGIIKQEDISCLYIEKPTNILINTSLFNETTNEDLLKYIYQVEALKTNGEITIKDKNICVKEAFLRTNNSSYKRCHTNLYKTNSIRNHSLSIIIQAVGRICRTRGKVSKTNIYVDNDIAMELDLLSVQNRRLNREFQEIITKFKELDTKTKNESSYKLYIRKAENSNKVVNDNIHRILSKKLWVTTDIELWKNLRDHVLKKPVCNDVSSDNGLFSNCYLQSVDYDISYYYYKEENDYGEVKIGLTKNNELTSIVSADESNLTLFMKNEMLKSFFESKGYATTFEKAKYILLPVVFNNIYKGALGEAIGKYCLSKIGYELEEIEDSMLYEKFDYKYKTCFIDFKNWNDRGQSLDIEHSKNKLESIRGDLAIIINIIGLKEERVKQYDNVYIIPNLFYIENDMIVYNQNAHRKIIELLGDK
ncbi:MAG: hypothetical protein K6E87_00940 [bacterium]|nr:hypothetical protein [bacterium]